MYPSKEDFMTGAAIQEKFNSFQYWREPIQDISFADLNLTGTTTTSDEEEKSNILPRFDSFLYWREPIPDIDDDDFFN